MAPHVRNHRNVTHYRNVRKHQNVRICPGCQPMAGWLSAPRPARFSPAADDVSGPPYSYDGVLSRDLPERKKETIKYSRIPFVRIYIGTKLSDCLVT